MQLPESKKAPVVLQEAKKEVLPTVREESQYHNGDGDHSQAYSSITGSSSSTRSHHPEEEQSITRSRRTTPTDPDKSPSDLIILNSREGGGHANNNSNCAGRSSSASSHHMAAAGAFASLTNPKNFVSLNGNDFVKLDVLGRGGSSKVFRVLSETGQVKRNHSRGSD